MQQEHGKGLFYSQTNKIAWLSNMQTLFCWEIHKECNGMWAFFFFLWYVGFSGADWLVKQTPLTWVATDSTRCLGPYNKENVTR